MTICCLPLTRPRARPDHKRLRSACLLLFLTLCLSAQVAEGPNAPAPAPPTDDFSSFWERFWISGQANFIRQQQPSFYAQYSGPNSLTNGADHATSRVLTLYTGFRILRNLDFLFDLEETGGAGLSNTLGVAGFPNVDVVRNPTLGQAPYVARIMLHWTIPLSGEITEATRNPNSLAPVVPVRRLEVRLGKMSTVDFFDTNSVGSDSHLQFMNWAAVNNGAYDYAADTRGYTYGLYLEYDDKWGAFRFGEMLMPTVANGIKLDWDIARAAAQNFELELHPSLLKNRATVIRPLACMNHANMGSYRQAINDYLSGQTTTPDIISTREQGRIKYGFGFNVEQDLNQDWRAFGRLGWNDGRTESFAYTEIDRTAQIGMDYAGRSWHRKSDKVGIAFIDNGITGDHARYLQLGGLGFILGDGGLTYGQERIVESYYNAQLFRGIYSAFDIQHIDNPGYNQARGPAWVFSIRLHAEAAVPLH